jgi:hypothetical protein
MDTGRKLTGQGGRNELSVFKLWERLTAPPKPARPRGVLVQAGPAVRKAIGHVPNPGWRPRFPRWR